jgi:hypothetical protein
MKNCSNVRYSGAIIASSDTNLNALIVLAAHKRLVGHQEIELLQRRLRNQTPQTRVRIVLNELVRRRDAGGAVRCKSNTHTRA